jgi:hypothetical protein
VPKTVDHRPIRRSWMAELDTLNERIAQRFSRAELRRRVRAYLRGLFRPIERKNSWQLAKAAGDETPYRASSTSSVVPAVRLVSAA